MSTHAYFSLGIDTACSDPLRYELLSLRKPNESKYYWIAAEFRVDKIVKAKEDSTVTLYYVHRRYQRKQAILQSNWAGMEYLRLIERK